jgi:NADH-quinone oxidoreductase subunit D
MATAALPAPDLKTELITLNMGPQHPSTHGVLRVLVTLDGETVVEAVPVIGYLHRAMEKLAENRTWNQFIPYTDRLDYLAPLSNNIAYVMSVEKLLQLKLPARLQAMRVVCCELARISAHLLWLGTHAIDLGAITPFFYTFNDRERLYNIFEKMTGARFTVSFARVGGALRDFDDELLHMIRDFLADFPKTIAEVDSLLTKNRIWCDRTRGIGIIEKDYALGMGITGPPLRASGVDFDLRKKAPYLLYDQLDFEVPVGTVGDVYDRYLVRLEEMRQSVKILNQLLKDFPAGPFQVEDPKVTLPPKDKVLTKMEELIYQFMLVTEMQVPAGEAYSAIEGPKGELGFYCISNGAGRPWRTKIRSTSFMNLQCLPKIAKGAMVADLVAIIASLDPVMGEVDK